MRFGSSRLASGLPMDWHERASIGGARSRPRRVPGFVVGLAIGLLIGAALVLLVAGR